MKLEIQLICYLVQIMYVRSSVDTPPLIWIWWKTPAIDNSCLFLTC